VLSAGTGSTSATFRTSGTQTLTATDVAGPLTGSGTFAVAAGPATHFALTLPATVDPRVPFGFQVMTRGA
jgi:hypothetical protein